MLFHSSIRKELGRSFGATLVVLVTIVMTFMLIRSLKQASLGSVNPSDVMLVMGYSVLGHLPTILTLSLFIAIVSALSRMYADSEMVIWFSAGRGLASFVGPLLRFSWPILLVIVTLALVGWPWSNQQTREMIERFEKRGDIERISPGLFQESAAGNRVFFIDKDSTNSQTGKNVFISAIEHGRETVTSARSGHIEVIDNDRFLMLSNGQRVENAIGTDALKISEFQEYGVRIGRGPVDADTRVPASARSTLSLVANPTAEHQGELSWRLGLALAGLNFVLIALAVSRVNPRVGRGGNLLFAMFAWVLYYNFINLGQSWINSQKVAFETFMIGMHGGVLVLALLGLLIRHQQWSFQLRLPRTGSTATHTGDSR